MDSNANSDDNQRLEVSSLEFERLCTELGVSGSIKVRAWNTWCDFTSRSDESQIQTQHGHTAVLYIAVIDSSMPYGPDDPHLDKKSAPCMTLTELLKKSNMNVVPFTKVMRTLREEITLSELVLAHLSNVEKRYCIVSPLFGTFNRVWDKIFRKDDQDSRENQGPFSRLESIEHRKRLCWTLFLWAKECLLEDNQELIRAYNLLLCCVEFVIRSTPSFQLMEPFDLLKVKESDTGQTNKSQTVLEKLAECFQATYDDLHDVHVMFEDFLTSLKNSNEELELKKVEALYHDRYRRVGDLDETLFLDGDPHLIPDSKYTRLGDLDETLFLDGDPHLVPDSKYRMVGDLDETLFLDGDPHLIPESKVVTSTIQTSKEAPVTPVRAAMNTVQQLKNILATADDRPCDELKNYFQNCSTNPENSISDRLSKLQRDFTQQYCAIAGSTHKSTADQRFKMGTRLYYRVMHTLLKMEQERLSQSDFSNLLNNESFHKSLLACSVEIVLVTYNISWNPTLGALGSEDSQFVFPWILNVFNLFAYEFYKVLESFIKAEPNLTRDIRKHLTNIENRILDSIAWKEGSPLHDAIAKCDDINTNLSSPTKDLTNGYGSSRPTSSTAELYLSPLKGQQARTSVRGRVIIVSPRKLQKDEDVGQSRQSPSSKTQEAAATAPKRSHSLNLFFTKVGRLGYQRLSVLSERLNVPRDIVPKIWTCFEYSLTNRPDLLKNRHLDQILMCSLYGMCKVFNNEIKFKDIVKMYCMLPHAESKTYKHVFIQGEEHDTVVMFYNKVYMPNMKTYILQFAKPVQPNLSPVPHQVGSALTASPRYSLPGKKNFHVSPMRESPFKAPHSPGSMTPRSRQLYSFGEGPGSAEKLKNINETLSAFKSRNGQNKKTPKRLMFDSPADDNQNSPGSSQDKDSPVIIIKKKRVTPPDVVTKTGNGLPEV